MRQAMILTIICSIIGAIILYPKEKKMDIHYEGPVQLNTFFITLTGEVNFPGEYQFYDSITLEKVIFFAGGLRIDADLSSISLSMIIQRDREIHIPTITHEEKKPEQLININTASFKDLLNVPNITESRAASIIIYRETHGYFTSLDDLIHVKYIGVATLEKIKPYFTL